MSVTLPPEDKPLYSHTLPAIEQWLGELGCEQDSNELHCWRIHRDHWQAEIFLETEELLVVYLDSGEDGEDLKRSFRYSLSRQDVESAVFSGP